MTDAELALRAEIMRSFADTGAPPEPVASEALDALAERHVVVLDGAGRIVMAHPFAAHRDGASVDAGGRRWWGNCAWDALGIVAALDLPEATIGAQDVTLRIRGGELLDAAVFHVAVPARHWWEDIAHT